jgi:hypothetical protein
MKKNNMQIININIDPNGYFKQLEERIFEEKTDHRHTNTSGNGSKFDIEPRRVVMSATTKTKISNILRTIILD